MQPKCPNCLHAASVLEIRLRANFHSRGELEIDDHPNFNVDASKLHTKADWGHANRTGHLFRVGKARQHTNWAKALVDIPARARREIDVRLERRISPRPRLCKRIVLVDANQHVDVGAAGHAAVIARETCARVLVAKAND